MHRWHPDHLQVLIDTLKEDGFRVLGPVRSELAMTYGDLDSLPVGWGDRQEAGEYRLVPRGDQSRFGFNLGPSTWKQFLYPSEEAVFRVRDGEFISAREAPEKMAFIGVRGCEFNAIGIQDQVFGGAVKDPGYTNRRNALFVVAVNCSQAASTCFCSATGDGPEVQGGADLVLTEINPKQPYYLVEARTEAGRRMLSRIGSEAAPDDASEQVSAALAEARGQMSRSMDKTGLADALLGALEHPRWDEVAQRCLACGNCTQVCPTCFCSSSQDQSDPISGEVSHVRHWDSCFTQGHSYLVGGAVHDSVRSRYRQWLTHKVASWEKQFGLSGCTGCGRCITWCPVGIDITEEIHALRGEP